VNNVRHHIYIYKAKTRCEGHVAGIREERNAYRILVGEQERKRLIGRPRYGREDNVKMDLREIGLGCMYWIHLAQERPAEGSYGHDKMLENS
jgi:hypothetical protein